MIRLSHLNKLIFSIIFIYGLVFNFGLSIAAVDIWEKKENKENSKNEGSEEKKSDKED